MAASTTAVSHPQRTAARTTVSAQDGLDFASAAAPSSSWPPGWSKRACRATRSRQASRA